MPYNSYNISLESLALDQLIIHWLIFFFLSLVCLNLYRKVKLYGETCLSHSWKLKCYFVTFVIVQSNQVPKCMNSEFLFWLFFSLQEELLFSKKKREDKKRNKKLKSKLNDEDISDLADIMGETCWPVSSDGVVFTPKKRLDLNLKLS